MRSGRSDTRLSVPWQKPVRSRRKPRWGALLALLVVLYFGYSSLGQIRLALELRQKIAAVNAQIEAGRQRTEELKKEITYLKSDAYVEKAAREQLGLVKPGEIIFLPAEKEPASK